MHKAFTSLCNVEYSESSDSDAAAGYCGDEHVSSVFNLFDSIGLYS